MRAVRTSLLVAVVLVPVAQLGAQQSGDPVLEQLLRDRAQLRLDHAAAELLHCREVMQWAEKLPMEEEIGQLVFVTGRRSDADSYRSVVSEMEHCEAELVEAEKEVTLCELDLEEIETTRCPPRSGWNVTLVDGRDIQGDRMRARLEAESSKAARRASRYAMMQTLVDRRAIPWREQAAAAIALAETQSVVETIQRELDMRQLMLENKLPPDARFILEDESLTRRKELLETRLERARVHVDELVPLTSGGIATQLDLDLAEESQRELEQALEILEIDRFLFDQRYDVWLERRSESARSPRE